MDKEFHYCPICGHKLVEGIKDGRKRKFCPFCGFVDYKNPLPSVAIVGIKNNRVLLIKRGREPHKGLWTPPSGFIEYGESPEDAGLRELKEETGMQGEIKQLLGVHSHNSYIYGNILVIIYYAEITNGKLRAGDDAEDARFFELNKVPDMKFQCFHESLEKVKNIIYGNTDIETFGY